MDQQFSEGAHDEENRQAGEGIGHYQAWSRLGDRLGRTEEQADADGAADGNQLNVAILKPTLEVLCLVSLFFVQYVADS